MSRKLFAFIFVGLALALPARAWQQGVQTKESDGAAKKAAESYEALVEKVKKSDMAVDFTELRKAYTRTKSFSGYGGLDKKEAFGALNSKDYKKALKLAEERLKTDYRDPNAHYISIIAYKETGETEKAEFHRQVLVKLVESIEKSGDGKTKETAYEVVAVDEEYFMINYLGYRPASQSLLNADGHVYDSFQVVNSETKESQTLYFRIDSFFGKF